MAPRYFQQRIDVPFAAVKVGQTCRLKRAPREIVSKVDDSTAFASFGLGFRMYGDDTVSIRRAWIGRVIERVQNSVRRAAQQA